MSDLYLDARTAAQRSTTFATGFLQYYSDVQARTKRWPEFSLVLTRCDDQRLWGSYEDSMHDVFVGLVGRLALDEAEWSTAEKMPGVGGLACKAVARRYHCAGKEGLLEFNGNFILFIYDGALGEILLVTDRLGMVPLFFCVKDGMPVISTHADLLASATGQGGDYDTVSLADFIATGRVSFPHTFYKGIQSLDAGSVHVLRPGSSTPLQSSRYFSMNYEPSRANVKVLSEELAHAFQSSVKRRTLPRLGTTAISLSGGLDSRMILCAVPEGCDVSAFSFFDRENAEFRIARQIAMARGIPFQAFHRDPEHYGLAAERGVMIHGGMGSLANNHFLGFREQLSCSGVNNILTGFYCDYLFKGLALDRTHARWFQEARPGPYRHEWYRPVFTLNSAVQHAVSERLEATFPSDRRDFRGDSERLWIEGRRLFPMAFEPDSAEAIIPQRTMGWAPPIADNAIIDVYRILPVCSKLNQSVYTHAVEIVCGPTISRIPDANTWAPVNAHGVNRLFRYALRGLANRAERCLQSRLASSGSWPNWEFYIHHSPVISRLWDDYRPGASALLSDIVGFDLRHAHIADYRNRRLEFFIRLLTLAIWMGVKPLSAQPSELPPVSL